jgi:hypothetical protein
MLILWLFILLFPVETQAQKACTQIGCTDGLMLRADPSFDWEPGIYEFTVMADARTLSCRGVLPLKPCGNTPTFGCNSQNIRIGESGCALPTTQHAISDIWISGSPKRVVVSATRNGRPFLSRVLLPEYQRLQPNGEGCGPVCESATYDLLTTTAP